MKENEKFDMVTSLILGWLSIRKRGEEVPDGVLYDAHGVYAEKSNGKVNIRCSSKSVSVKYV